MTAGVHTGGYVVDQVQNLTTECLFLICLELLFFLRIAIFGISLEALIRLHGVWRTYGALFEVDAYF